MRKVFQPGRCRTRVLVFVVCLMAVAGRVDADPASLRAKQVELSAQLGNSPFGRPLHLVSTEHSNQLKGDIHALMDYPLGTVSEAFSEPGQWCEVLLLHLNTKYCQVAAGRVLVLGIGKKVLQPVEDAYRMDFAFRIASRTAEYLDVGLYAKAGPLGTKDIFIQLEAVSVPGRKTFLHLSYSYTYNFAARMAMQGYLSTLGRGKVGFTRVDKPADSPPEYIGGVRGVLERNTMRYYLAIDAYLGSLSAPPAERIEKRLQDWFALTEQYPRQLREIEQAEYLAMKRREYPRQ